jgi:hypothetical protein
METLTWRFRHRDNVKIDVTERVCENVNSINPAQKEVSMGSFCEGGNELSGFITVHKFLLYLKVV